MSQTKKSPNGMEATVSIRFAVLIALLGSCVQVFAQKAPVDITFGVSSTTRLKLQSVPIKVEIKPTKSLPYMALSSSAAENLGSPNSITATNLKPKQITRLIEKLLLSPNDIGFLTIAMSGKQAGEFSVPDTVGIPVSNTGPMLKFGTPVTGIANGHTISSQVNVNAAVVDAPTEVDGYRSVAKFSVDIQKGGLKLNSKQVDHVLSAITTEGGVSIVSAEPLTKRLPLSTDPVVDELPFSIVVGERGTITGQVVAKDAQGKILYGRKTVLYVLSDKRKLYTGTGSFVDLDIQKLQDDRTAGDLTEDQYQEQRSRLLAGKVTETN